MKTITEDPEEFFESGGWTFLDPESDDEKEDVDDEEEDEDDAYEVSFIQFYYETTDSQNDNNVDFIF